MGGSAVNAAANVSHNAIRQFALGFRDEPLTGRALETAKEAGYDYVEISIDETEEKISRLDMTGEERFEMVSAMYETGLPIRTMCVSALTKYSLGNDDPQFSARGMEILEKSIR